MRRTVAPVLRRWVGPERPAPEPDGNALDAMRVELRALLAVARAADAERHSPGNTHVDVCMCPLCRALSRLSTPKRARKR